VKGALGRFRWLSADDIAAAVLLAVGILAPLTVRDNYFLDTISLILLWGAMAGAWNIAGGFAGQVSLGHAAFFGLGAYLVALPQIYWGWSAWFGLLLGAGLSAATGLIVGYLSNRLRGPYFALGTIALSQVLLIVFSRWREVTRGGEGVPIPFRPGLENLAFVGKAPWVYVMLVYLLVVFAVALYFERGRFGYLLAAVREDEDAAEALGIDTRRLKVVAIVVSALLTAVGGALWAQSVGFVDPFYVFSIDISVKLALVAIIGGMGRSIGPLVGSVLIISTESYLRATLSGPQAGQTGLYLIIYGLILILVVRFLPQGLAPLILGLFRRQEKAGVGS
jgi:branched-chain amino acid transport system permease protein